MKNLVVLQYSNKNISTKPCQFRSTDYRAGDALRGLIVQKKVIYPVIVIRRGSNLVSTTRFYNLHQIRT
jgi:hypothetical protein